MSVALLVASAFAGSVAVRATAAGSVNTLHVASYLDQPVTSQGQQFFSKDIYIEKTGNNITVSGSADGTASFYVDDIASVTVTQQNGTVGSTSIDDSNGCTASTVLTTPAENIARFLGTGINKLHVTFRDACGGDYGNSDIWITGTANFLSPAATLPTMDGGTFVLVVPTVIQKYKGQGCTTAFSVTKDNVAYMLTAKHCIDGEQGDQTTNQYVNEFAPFNITTNDSRYTFAQQLTCAIGPLGCLLPPNKSKPTGDMVAFRPDTAVPTNRVQTAYGLLPDLGPLQWAKGQTLCHFGSGIHGESCGTVTSKSTSSGVVSFSASSVCGDSGGPVYAYSFDQGGNPNGVQVAGMVVLGGLPSNNCKVGPSAEFIPVDTIRTLLGAELLT